MPRIKAAARAAGVKDFQIFGEAFITDSLELSAYMRYRALPNVIDFPLWDSAVRYVSGAAGARAVSIRFEDDDYFNLPNGIAFTPTTFLGNHDVGRPARLIQNQFGATGDELLQRTLLGYSLLYLVRGAPVVMSGDEVGMIGAGGDKQARQDMFPTQVRYWQQEERLAAPPIGTGSSFDVVGHPVGRHLSALGALRDAHPALSTGSSAVRFAREGRLVLSRFDLAERREYIVAFNAAPTATRVTVPTATPSTTWLPLLGTGETATSDSAGRLSVSVPALTAVLLKADADLPARQAGGGDREGRPGRSQRALPGPGDRGGIRPRDRHAGDAARPGRRLEEDRHRPVGSLQGVRRPSRAQGGYARPLRRGGSLELRGCCLVPGDVRHGSAMNGAPVLAHAART